ncbi:MAG: hypothetical protein Q9223_005963 [Gallowayella weberi]
MVDILHNDDIPRYAKKLIIGPTIHPERLYSDSFDEDREEAAKDLFRQNLKLLRPLFPLVPSHFSDNRWLVEVFHDGCGLYYSMPLVLLPRVDELELIDSAAKYVPGHIESYLWRFHHTLKIESPFFTPCRSLPPAINNLKRITLTCRPAYGFIGSQRLYELALLPNLRTLHANAISTSERIFQFPWGHGNGGLQHLYLQQSEVHHEALYLILSAPERNSLETFEYELCSMAYEGPSWQLYKIVDALSEPCLRKPAAVEDYHMLVGLHSGCHDFPRLSRITVHRVDGDQTSSRDYEPKNDEQKE